MAFWGLNAAYGAYGAYPYAGLGLAHAAALPYAGLGLAGLGYAGLW